MRILHTSDWHLGIAFNGASMYDEQVAALDRIIEITSAEDIDLVIIAGDLYDRSFPPGEAVTLFDSTIARLQATGAKVVAISGNHDSGPRVGVYDKMLASTGVSIRGDINRCAEPIIVQGSTGAPVAVYPIPYLDPGTAAGILQNESDADVENDLVDETATRRRRLNHDQVTMAATQRVRADLVSRGLRSVVIAHTFVDGGTSCDSERQLTVGNIDKVGLDAFADFNYVALGHLHGRQEFSNGRIAYSGTPLPYSFSEEAHTKSVRIVEMADNGSTTVNLLDLNVGLRLQTVTGTLDQLLNSSEFAHAEGARVRAYLTDPHMPLQAMAQLRKRFPHAVSLQHIRATSAGVPEVVRTFDPARPAHEIVLDFWRNQQKSEPDSAEAALLRAAVAATVGQSQL